MRYVQVPEPFTVLDPATDEPIKMGPDGKVETITFAKLVAILCTVAASKGTTDALTLIDIRAKFAKVAVGEWVELSEEWWKILEGEARRPGGLSPAAIMSAGTHLRVILRAPEEKPAIFASNGAKEAPATA